MMPVPMVGRDDELAELARAWSRPRQRPVTALLTGAAGCGKSLLVTAALDAFEPPPRTVLFGRARLHTPAPYDWLAAALVGRDTAELPIPADALAWLAQQPDTPSDRYAPGALLRLAVRTVHALAGPGPTVIVVEDLHSLDPASLSLIVELAATPGLPALLLVTSRPPEEAVSPQLTARTLARLAGTPGAIRQHLGPLGDVEVGALLEHAYGSPAPREVIDAVVQHTGGNPYVLTELLAAGRAAGRAAGVMALASAELPEHVRPLAAPQPAAPQELTAREREVLSCLAAGMSNKQVARSLGISIRTVTVHVSNLLRKTRSSSRTEAALWAVRHRVAEPQRSR